MEPFVNLNGVVMPLNRANVDTDQIIPAKYLKGIKRTGMAEGLFANWRYKPDGSPDPDFPLNQARYQNATILVARDNFGCGSSREHAPWALNEYGFRSIIAPSFADIFYNNCFNNGMLPITLPKEAVDELFEEIEAEPRLRIQIDLPNQTINVAGGKTYSFQLDPFKKECLLNGLDNIGWTLSFDDKIAAFEAVRREATPWL
ncbi:3-isopropylmalate dehydratase small subunit [Candidatus Chlorohelix sp.]|uniref:3-isopropylmalate dehydratase small subunit n=1 Tax=Candidatus Chlorohelix sp. TaxID=3139201 RepID=UPI0030359BC7